MLTANIWLLNGRKPLYPAAADGDSAKTKFAYLLQLEANRAGARGALRGLGVSAGILLQPQLPESHLAFWMVAAQGGGGGGLAPHPMEHARLSGSGAEFFFLSDQAVVDTTGGGFHEEGCITTRSRQGA